LYWYLVVLPFWSASATIWPAAFRVAATVNVLGSVTEARLPLES
jgi:hypothetical protein